MAFNISSTPKFREIGRSRGNHDLCDNLTSSEVIYTILVSNYRFSGMTDPLKTFVTPFIMILILKSGIIAKINPKIFHFRSTKSASILFIPEHDIIFKYVHVLSTLIAKAMVYDVTEI